MMKCVIHHQKLDLRGVITTLEHLQRIILSYVNDKNIESLWCLCVFKGVRTFVNMKNSKLLGDYLFTNLLIRVMIRVSMHG